ncbi:MAG: hypothetical protein EKK64_07100 [Neisseriaceae bacterium]|nr:MAG: hypothetical protein EKK64_07100 [Neisseriaceae bacterium]
MVSIFPSFVEFFRDAAECDLKILKEFKLIEFNYVLDEHTNDFSIICGTRNVGLLGKLNLKNIVVFVDNVEKFKKISIKKFEQVLKDFKLDLKISSNKVQITQNKDLTSFFKVLFSRFHIDLLTDERMENAGARKHR